MKKLTLSKARQLLKRELGISALAVKAPQYELQSGAMRIRLRVEEHFESKFVELYMSFDDGLPSLSRFYYLDTLELAIELTELSAYQDTKDRNAWQNEESLKCAAAKACANHFGWGKDA